MVSSRPCSSKRAFGSRYSARMRSARASLLLMNSGLWYALSLFNLRPLSLAASSASCFSTRASSAYFKRHFGRLDRYKQHVCFEGEIGHVQHRLSDVIHVHQRLDPDRAVGLRHALGHALGHLGARIADVYLADCDVVLAAIERAALGEAGHR